MEDVKRKMDGRVTPELMKTRTKQFALAVVRFCSDLPNREDIRIISRQLMRSATSVGANYRASQRGRSKKEFIAKMGIVVEEADECQYWLELLEELDAGDRGRRDALLKEASELVAITVSVLKSSRHR